MKDTRIPRGAPSLDPKYKCDCGCQDYDNDEDCCMYECTGCDICEPPERMKRLFPHLFDKEGNRK